MKLRTTVLNGICVTICLVGCSGAASDQLVDVWYEVGGTERLQFFDDGTVHSFDDEEITGTYTFPDDGTIKLEFSGLAALAGALIMNYEIDGDTLRLMSADGSVDTYSTNESVRRSADATETRRDPPRQSGRRETVSAMELQNRMNEGRRLSGGARAVVTEFYQSNDYFPDSNSAAGLQEPAEIYGQFVSEVAVKSGGTIHVRYDVTALGLNDGAMLVFKPVDMGGSIMWECEARVASEFEEAIPQGCSRGQ